jgi:Ca2+-transporting ATPase
MRAMMFLLIELGRALAVADRASNAVLQEGPVRCRATSRALAVAAHKAGREAERLEARFECAGEVPFSSERKLLTTIHTDARRTGAVKAAG